jgi:SOS response regulatory protein OraA/RecX
MESNPSDQLHQLIMKKVRIDYDFVRDKEKLKQKTLRYVASRGHNIGEAMSIYPDVLAQYIEEQT